MNRAWGDVIATELALDESSQSQPLLDQLVNAKPSRRVGAEGLGMTAERLEQMDLRRNLTPAVIAYKGIQYRYMAPSVMEPTHLDYLREHLRILSGFYGLLRPFDGVTPYRLEMQAKLVVDGCRDLYQFWGSRLAKQLASKTDVVLNLASKEYSRAVGLVCPKPSDLSPVPSGS